MVKLVNQYHYKNNRLFQFVKKETEKAKNPWGGCCP